MSVLTLACPDTAAGACCDHLHAEWVARTEAVLGLGGLQGIVEMDQLLGDGRIASLEERQDGAETGAVFHAEEQVD